MHEKNINKNLKYTENCNYIYHKNIRPINAQVILNASFLENYSIKAPLVGLAFTRNIAVIYK